MITSRDIARLAGVSQTTVSRVLNNRGKVAPEKAELVRKIIQETGYQPNALARSFVTRRAETIGLFLFTYGPAGHLMDPWTGSIVNACQRALRQHGYMLMFDLIENKTEYDRAVAALQQRRVDGAIFFGGRHDIDVLPLLSEGLPIAVVNRRWLNKRQPHAVQITADNFGGMRASAEHLVSLGHRRIALLAGNLLSPTPQVRLAGYRSVLEPLGLYDESLIIPELVDGPDRFQVVHSLLTGPWRTNPPTAVACFSDDWAEAMITGCQDLGIKVPDEISVIGFDNRFPTRCPFTSITLPLERMCQLGVENLVRLIDGQFVRDWDVVLPCPLVMRNTTAPPAVR